MRRRLTDLYDGLTGVLGFVRMAAGRPRKPAWHEMDRRITWTMWNWSFYLVLLGAVMFMGGLGYR